MCNKLSLVYSTVTYMYIYLLVDSHTVTLYTTLPVLQTTVLFGCAYSYVLKDYFVAV